MALPPPPCRVLIIHVQLIARASRFNRKVLVRYLLFLFAWEDSMYTIESFCNAIWETSYSKVSQGVTKEEYGNLKSRKKADRE